MCVCIFICVFLAMLGVHCGKGFSLVVLSGGYALVAMPGLLIAVACRVAGLGL